MAQIRALPVAVAVVATEIVLAPIGSEISWQAARHEVAYQGAAGLLLRSVGAPWNAPWHPVLWRIDGASTTLGLVLFLILLGAGTAVLARSVRTVGALFLAIWGVSTLALAASQIVRLLVAGGAEARYGGSATLSYALYGGAASISHALYFSWLSALVGAVVGLVTGADHTARESSRPHWLS